jgi:hypothetical protein
MRHRNDESWESCETAHAVCLAALLLALLSPLRLLAQTLSGATVQPGRTGLTLPAGAGIYLYAMGTGGGRPSANFAQGPYAQVVDAAGYTVAGLAITRSPNNSFSTQTDYHTVGGISVSGFKIVRPYYASSPQPGAASAAAHFVVSSPAVVVVIGVAGGETNLELMGLPGLQVDAQAANQSGVIAIVIAHTSLGPGEYDVSEQTSGNPDQNPNHAGDLIGVFVFMGDVEPKHETTAPVITSVSAIPPQPVQTILIKGNGFGTVAPYISENSPYLAIGDNTARMEAGHVGDAVTLNVARWTDTEIEVTGFGGAYGMGTWVLNAGDHITVRVWNAQTGTGPAAYDLVVGAAAVPPPPTNREPSIIPRHPPPTPRWLLGPPAPVPIFNGAFAAYNLRFGNVSANLKVAVSDVDLSNRTCTVAVTLGGRLSNFSTIKTVNFEQFPFWGLKASDLDLIRGGKPPGGLPDGAQVRPDVTVSVPAGTFASDQLDAPDGTVWFDEVSGIYIKGRGSIPDLSGRLPGLDTSSFFAELTGTNVPMNSVTSPVFLYGAAIGIGVLALGIIAYMFIRGSKGRVAPVTARMRSVQAARAWAATSPEEPATLPGVSAGGSPPPAITNDALDKLAKLKSLLDAGLITVEEFQQQKAKLLG